EEDESEQPPPEPKKSRKKVTRVTQGKNPPRVKPPPVTCYDGGPSDLSLLPGFGKHVVVPLWKGELQTRYLRVMNNVKKINNFKPCPKEYLWFWNVVNASGLEPLRWTNYNHTDWGLLTAFAERWHPETGTFHLPIGEMTITLDDVSSLLHIPITGKMLDHNGTSCTKEDGAHIGFKELKDLYIDNLKSALKAERLKKPAEDVEFLRECTIRCYLLYLIGATIFTNK
ncbi:putative IMP dehydrogenase/GMP reductase, partial [Trifolium pratense]